MDEKKYSLNDFVEIIKTLRGENGCPWDKKQTHTSLKKGMLEEAYEVMDAIDNEDYENLCEELGDVLLQIIFHAEIAAENGKFDFSDVVDGISKKMVSRHTHIFGDEKIDSVEEVLKNWEEIKKKEKNFENYTDTLKSVSKNLPALIRAEKIQTKVSKLNFDYNSVEEVILNVEKNLEKIKVEIMKKNDKNGNIYEKYSDLLFDLVNLSRFLKINSEFALTNATEKFINRFGYVENCSLHSGLKNLSQVDFLKLWEQSKQC